MAVTGRVAGKDGGITFANGYVVDCDGWTLDIEAEEIEYTGLGDSWGEYIPGVKRWSGTFSTRANSASLDSFETMGIGEAAAAATLIYDATSSTDGEFSGTIIVTGSSINAGTGATPTTITFTFRGTSTLSLTPAQDA